MAAGLVSAIDARAQGAYAIAPTAGNVSMLDAWMANEGGLWADNPLNTSLDASRYPHQFTSGGQDTGIPIFPTIGVGIDATAATLLGNRAYADILGVLNTGTGSCAAFARAVIQSPWAASHYGWDTSRFCGATGGSTPVPVVTTACLRLPGGTGRGAHRSHHMPGDCGRREGTPARSHRLPATSHRVRSSSTTHRTRGQYRSSALRAPVTQFGRPARAHHHR